MRFDFKGGLCSPNPLKTIGFIKITGKASIKETDGVKTIFLEFPLANI